MSIKYNTSRDQPNGHPERGEGKHLEKFPVKNSPIDRYRLRAECSSHSLFRAEDDIYSESNDSQIFVNKKDSCNAGQQKLLHHVKLLDDHLENLRSKINQ